MRTVTMLWIGTALALPMGSLAADAPPPEAGKWLTDLARDYALEAGTHRIDPADAASVLVLLASASRVDPALAEPHYWRYDLLTQLGRTADAAEALAAYAAREPDDLAARAQVVDTVLAGRQTSEGRQAFLEDALGRPGLPDEIASDLHRRLAELFAQRRQLDAANRHVERALELVPLNVAARRLQWELAADADAPAQRVRLALRLIEANPTQVNLVWELAGLLDDLSLHDAAIEWYRYAIDVHTASTGQAPGADYLMDLAACQLDAGRTQPAFDTAGEAIAAEPDSIPARLLMVEICRRLGREDLAQGQIRAIGEHYDAALDTLRTNRDFDAAAQAAWFYARYQPMPKRAMELATLAMSAPAPDATAKIAYGFAAVDHQQYDDAVKVLAPLAADNPWAAIALAQAYFATQRPAQAIATLRDAARLRHSGVAYRQIAEMLAVHGQKPPPMPDRSDELQILNAFDRAVLGFAREPKQYVSFSATFTDDRYVLTQPVRVRFEMSNIGPFAVTCGPGMMVSPTVVLSAVTAGDRMRQWPGFMSVSMNRCSVLPPGRSIVVEQTLDVGPLRRLLHGTPQVAQQIALSATLDAVMVGDGKWVPALGGQTAPTVRARRVAFVPDAGRLDRVLELSASGSVGQRAAAAGMLACLLAERQHIAAGRLRYSTRPLDASTVQQALLAALDDPHWYVRTRTVEGLRRIRLDASWFERLAGVFGDPHWLVRLMGVLLMAEQQGSTFARPAATFADNDPDELVRQLAKAYLARWRQAPAPTTRPAPDG